MSLTDDKRFAVAIIAVTVVILLAGWIIKSNMEAKAFHRVTGKRVSTWDAMWIELRVQEGSDG